MHQMNWTTEPGYLPDYVMQAGVQIPRALLASQQQPEPFRGGTRCNAAAVIYPGRPDS